MNVSNHNFEGTGMREASDAESEKMEDAQTRPEPSKYEAELIAKRKAIEAYYAAQREQEQMADAVSEALSQPTGAEKDRGIFERSIAVRRVEKAKQLQIAKTAAAKARELTVVIRAMEDAVDGMSLSEV